MALVWLPFSSHAGNLYWDTNGATAGAGGATPTGTWGTDNFWSASSAGTLATIAWTAGESAVFSAGNDATGTFSVTVSGTQSAGGVAVEEGNLTLSGGTVSLGASASVSVAASRSLTLQSTIAGSSWSKVNQGLLSLNSPNTYTGSLTINGGAVRFNANGAAGFGSIVVSPLTSDVFLQNSSGGVVLTNSIVLNSGQNVDISSQSGSLTLNGDISGGRSLWSVGGQAANTVVFGGNNTFTGNVDINGGTLVVTRNNALGTVGNPTKVSSGATLAFQSGFNYSAGEDIKLFGDGVGNLGAIQNISGVNQFSGPIDLQTSVTVGAVSGSLDLNGTISGSAFNITKVGTGRIIISGLANTFAATAVAAGTLQVETTLGSGAVTVSAGATLAGNGTVAGNVLLSGEISPGSSPGSLKTGTETWNSGASYLWEINEADFGSPGNGWDLVDLTTPGAGLAVNSTSLNPFVIKITSLDPGNDMPGDAGDFDETLDYNFAIVQTQAGITGFSASNFVINDSLFSNFKGVGKFVVELANANKDLVLKFIHPAFITSQPTGATKQCGVDSASFSVGAGGTGTLSYQWSSNGVPLVDDGRITGSATATLSISTVHLYDTANYSCFISNAYGTTNSANVLLSVVDTIAPALTCPVTVMTVANSGVCFATGVPLGTALAPDFCDAAPIITNNATASYPVGTNIVTWGATDGSGNHSQCQQLVIVTDNQLPLVAANPITRQLDNTGNYTLSAADINAITAGSGDNCGIASTNLNPTVFNFCSVGANNVTVTLTDIHGNVSNRVAVVTITAPPTPSVVYVDDDYPVFCAAVNFPSNGLPGPYYVGFNAFKTIQAGINAVASGGTVNVAAGSYIEDVIVNKPLALLGPNADINPNTGSRVAEATVIPFTSDPDPFSATSEIVIYVSSSNVTIKGFTVDGDNTGIVSGITNLVTGPDVDAAEGIVSYEGVGLIMISNNIIKNTSYSGVDFYNYVSSAATADNHIQGNKLQNIGHVAYGYGIGVLIYNNFYADISDNVMTDVRVGIQTGNFEQPNPGSTQSLTRNTITSTKKGIFHNLHYSGASPLSISNNIISVQNEAGASRWDGIMVSSIQTSVGVVVANNTITATPVAQTTVGYQLWNDPTTLGVTITGGTVSGANYGVWLNNYDGYGPSDGDSSRATVNGVTITGASLAGVYVKDNALNGNGATVRVTVTNNCSITGGSKGVLVEGADASAIVINNSASITGNGVGIYVSGGKARIQNNNLTGNTTAAIRIESGARVDAGDCSGGNVTGLGSSTGGNNLTGYGFDDVAPWAIENLNLSAEPAVYAQGNSFGAGGASSDIRRVIYDVKDNALNSVVHASDSTVLITCPPSPPSVQCVSLLQTAATGPDGFFTLGGASSATDGSFTHTDSGSVPGPNDGIVTRHYILTDACSQSANCDQTLPVDDTTAPIVVCQPFTATLSGMMASVMIAPADVFNSGSSSDNCGVVTPVLVVPDTFSCAGTYNVTLTGSDGNGNSNTCVAVVTVIDNRAAPAVVYVDDNYVGLPSGTAVSWPSGVGPATHLIDCDAFATVQGGVNRVATNGTVNVAAGSYSESVVVNKAATLLGANQGIAGCGARGSASLIAGGLVALDITADGVTVDGFDITGATGLRNLGHETVIVRNNAITAAAVGVDTEGVAPTAVAGVTISNNCVALTSQLAGPTPTLGMAIFGVSGTASPVIENNNISGAFYGYVLYNANVTSLSTMIKGGAVTGVRQGVAVFNIDPITQAAFSSSTFTVDGITMSGFSGATTHAGVNVSTFGPQTSAKITGLIKNLNVTGTGKPEQDSAGIVLADFSTAAGNRQSIAIEECTITNNLNRGISIRGSNCVATVTRCLVNNNGGDPFGAGGNDGFGIIARNGSQVKVTECYVTNPSAQAGTYGVHALAADANTNPEGPSLTVTNSSINNNGNALGKLAEQSAGTLNASGNYWGMTSDSAINALITGVVDFTPYLDSGADTSGAFAFQGDFATVHVTTLNAQTGSSTRIQEGVDMVSGSTVLVEAGGYTENVSITKKVVVDGTGSGTGAGDSIVTAANPALPVFLVTDAGGTGAGDRLTIKDLRVTGGSDGVRVNAATGTRQWYRIDNVAAVNNSGSGVALAGVATLGEVQVAGCALNNNGIYGLQVANTLTSFAALAVSGGSMDNNGDNGLAVNGLDANLTSPTQISVTGTTFNGNGSPTVAGDGDLSFFLFNGNAGITNVTVTADAQFPIQFRGKGTASPASWSALGTVGLKDVTISGATARPGLYLIRYSDVSNVSFENVDLSGVVPPSLPSGFASEMQVEHTGATPLNLHGLKLRTTYPGGPFTSGYLALAMLSSGGAVADCSTVILGASTVQELETAVFDKQDIGALGDVVFPVLALTPAAPNVMAECTGGGQAMVTFASPSVTADCPPTGPVVCTPASGSIFALGTNTVTCTVTDNRGISSSTNFAVIVRDTTRPDIASCAPNTNVVADASCQGITPDLTGRVTASDSCGSGALVYTQSPLAGSLINLGPNPVTLTVTDPSGNFSNCVTTVTVVDQTAPIVTYWPTNRTLSVGGGCTALVPNLTGEPLATDSCSPPVIVTQLPLAGTPVGLGVTTVTVTVADQVGNFTNHNTLLTIVDTSTPAITCPANVSVNRLSPTDPYATGFATASDNCTNVTVTYNDNRSGLTNCNATGDILRTWTATDAASNASNCVQTITITDTVPPLFTSSQTNITTTNDLTLCSAVVAFPTMTAVDIGYDQGFENPAWVSGSYVTTPSVDWNSDSSQITRVPSGTDGIASRSGAAHAVIDSTTIPASPFDYTGAFTRLGGYSSVFGTGYRASVDVYLNLADPAVTANTYGWDVSTAASGQNGAHRRDFIFHAASDASGNILIAADNNSNFTRRNDLASINHHTVTASGWYTLEWVFRDNGGVLAVDCNLRDAGGTLLFTETRSDPSDLIATLVGGNRYMWFTFLEVSKLAIDNTHLERNATVVCTPASGTAFNVGTNTVLCVASDACGNTTTNSFTVTVNDVQRPTITVSPNLVRTNDVNACSAVVGYSAPVVGDNCGVASTVQTSGLTNGAAFPVGTTVNTFVVTDIHGNTATNSFTVTVNDVQRPEIVLSPNLVTTNDVGLCSAVVSYDPPVPGDNCAVASTVQTTGLVSGAAFPVGTTVNTFVVTDIHGNTATNSFTVTVNDVQKPLVTTGSIATCYETSVLAEAAALAATSATDNCGVATTNIFSTVGTCSAVVTVRVTDIHGNFFDVTYNTRIDPTAPVISVTTATEVQSGGPVNVKNNNCLTTPVLQGLVLISVSATDNCSIVGGQPSVTMVNGTNTDSAVFINQSPAGTYNYSWLVTNVTANGTWTVTVAASDLCHNTTTNFTLCVNKSQVTGLVQLEGFVGTGAGVNHSRLVTFVATTNATVLKTWNLTLNNVSSDTFSYTLTDVPAGTTGISAKTDWNLREKLAVVLDLNGQAVANFVSDGIFGWSDATDHYLRGADLSAANPALRDNLVQFFDYSVLGSNFFTFNAVADITGDGQVDYDDYFILYLNYFTAGDPQ